MMTRKTPLTPWWTALAAAMMAAGCATSTLRGKVLGPSDDPDGIPYTLTQPVIVLQEQPATGERPRSYSVSVVQRPDPERRYSVSIQPPPFANLTMALELGGAGQIASLNGQVQSQATPVIQSLGDFAVAAVPVAATIAAGIPKAAGFAALLVGDTSAPLLQNLTLKRVLVTSGAGAVADRLTWLRSEDEHPRFVYPLTQAEKDGIRAASEKVAELRDGAFRDAMRLLSQRATGEDWKRDLATAAQAAQATPADLGACDPKADPNAPPAPDCLRATTRATAIAFAAQLMERSRAIKAALDSALALSPREIRYRHAAWLEDQIAAAEMKLPRDKKAAQEVAALRRQHAEAIGALDEYQRSLVLNQVLQSPPEKLGRLGKDGPALLIHERARKELELLQDATTIKRGALTPASPPPPPAPPPPDLPRELVLKPRWLGRGERLNDFLDAAAAKDDAPEFLVVIERGVAP